MSTAQTTIGQYHRTMRKKRQTLTEFMLEFAINSGRIIRKKKENGQKRVTIKISEQTYKKFIKYVKNDHFGVINGPLSLEVEKAMILYLHFYDN